MLQVLFVNIYLWFDIRIFYTANLSGVDPGNGIHFVLDRVQHLALPVIVLCVASIATYSRFMRAGDARGDQLRLRAHRPRQGAAGALGDHEATRSETRSSRWRRVVR